MTVSVPVAATELVVLLSGCSCCWRLNLVLLRPAFRPLDELAETMRRHDPLSPGERAQVDGGPDVAALAQTFNEMLDRLESERRESARRALMVQEGERRRIARELHDEVGQTLTGVMLQVEGLAAAIPDELREQLEELRETARARHRGRAPDRAPAAPGGARGARAAERAGRAGDRVRRAGARPRRPASGAAGLPLSEEQELVIYRVAQEALTNVARHAEATRVELRARATRATQIVLTVRDDGRGLPAGRAAVLARHPRHARARDAHRRAARDRPAAGRRHRGPARHPRRTGNPMTLH